MLDRSLPFRRAASLAFCALCIGACGLDQIRGDNAAPLSAGGELVPPPPARRDASPPPPAAAAQPACAVALQLFSNPGSVVPQVQRPENRLSGSFAIISDPVCLKAVDGTLTLPDSVQLYAEAKHQMCQEGTEVVVNDKKVECKWNRIFRDKYPVSFVLFTIDPQDSLTHHIRLLRVFRNGTLAYRWTAGVENLNQLIIPGPELKGTLQPHLSQIDLRAVPKERELPPGLDTADVVRRTSHLRERLDTALSALKNAPGSAVFRCEFERLESAAQATRLAVHTLLSPTASSAVAEPPGALASCAAETGEAPRVEELARVQKQIEATATQLRSSLKAAENGVESAEVRVARESALSNVEVLRTRMDDQLERFKQKAVAYWNATAQPAWLQILLSIPVQSRLELSSISDQPSFAARYSQVVSSSARATLPTGEAFQALIAWLRVRVAGDELERVLASADRVAASTLALTDAASTLIAETAKGLKAIVKDDQKAYELYNHLALSLNTTTVFEPRADNPAPLDGELVLPMKYSDAFQVFFGSPWFGVSTRPDDNFEADLNAGIAIPIIDAAGLRFQFGPSRFADLRFALGISMFGEKVADESFFHFAPQVNVGLGTLHLGFAYIVTGGGDLEEGTARMRVLLGVDLIKLITGRNVEID